MATYRPSEVARITGLSLSSVKNYCKHVCGLPVARCESVGTNPVLHRR